MGVPLRSNDNPKLKLYATLKFYVSYCRLVACNYCKYYSTQNAALMLDISLRRIVHQIAAKALIPGLYVQNRLFPRQIEPTQPYAPV